VTRFRELILTAVIVASVAVCFLGVADHDALVAILGALVAVGALHRLDAGRPDTRPRGDWGWP
jgi:hypothetical protein